MEKKCLNTISKAIVIYFPIPRPTRCSAGRDHGKYYKNVASEDQNQNDCNKSIKHL